LKKKILTVVGTRPNIIKITQFQKVVEKYPFLEHYLLHTGQHYSPTMRDVFFDELSLSPPHFSFDTDKSTLITQLADIMKGIEDAIRACKPEIVLVVGDVNSTLMAALVANKLNIKIGHVESGLRSFDRTMPEEHNRVMTDWLSDIFFVTEKSGYENLLKEGKSPENIYFVGNTMIDTLLAYDSLIHSSKILMKLNLKPKEFILITMHRPQNVDTYEGLCKLVEMLEALGKIKKIVFPIHPRTLYNLKNYGLESKLAKSLNLILLEPIGYIDFQNLILNCSFVITDSGGIQEETTFRQIPCITLRPNTERPVTVELGTNVLCNYNMENILMLVNDIENGNFKKGEIPPLWDGKSTERIFLILSKMLMD